MKPVIDSTLLVQESSDFHVGIHLRPTVLKILPVGFQLRKDLGDVSEYDFFVLQEVIVNGDSVSPIASASTGAEGYIPPKTAKQKLAMKNKLKAKSTLMLAIPDECLLKFQACKDAKS
ncbi:hypothetical protein Tco_0960826 [Tanacetum coccineum]